MKDGMKFTGKVKVITTDSKTGAVLRETPFMHNQVMASDGRGVYKLLDLLAGLNTDVVDIGHADIGTGSTAATAADTGLETGVTRGERSNFARAGLTTSYRFFYPDALTPNNTYREFGMFMNGTTTLGDGSIFNRIVFDTPLVKNTGEDNTIVCEITCSV